MISAPLTKGFAINLVQSFNLLAILTFNVQQSTVHPDASTRHSTHKLWHSAQQQ